MRDVICQVLVEEKSKDLIFSVLNKFIPDYEKLNLDYTGKIDDINYIFKSEEEMINYYVEKDKVNQTFYWNKYENNPDKIMVGVNILADNQIVFSLTIDGCEQKETEYFRELKSFLKSEIGVVSYINPVEYDSGKDFRDRYE
ncbi:protein of unknown function [Tenacibaculum sp. 190524A02b]|uniref:hypothetical protein n=1 Tax=Tenacibaculum vairaonense TaxID=3137860 RepID=UPI0032B263D3